MDNKILCPSCGKKILATAKHCGFCGVKMEELEIKASPSHHTSDSTYSTFTEFVPSDIKRGRRKPSEPPISNTNEFSEIHEEITLTDPENTNVQPTKICMSCGWETTSKAKFCGKCSGMLREKTSADTYNDDLDKSTIGTALPLEPPINPGITTENPPDSSGVHVKTPVFKKTTTTYHPDFKPASDL